MEEIPFTPGEPQQRLDVTIDGYPLIIEAKWVEREAVHTLDLWEADHKTPIAFGLNVVLGAFIGRQVRHEFFAGRVLMVVDRSGGTQDAGIDELGSRIAVVCLNQLDQFLLSTAAPKPPGA